MNFEVELDNKEILLTTKLTESNELPVIGTKVELDFLKAFNKCIDENKDSINKYYDLFKNEVENDPFNTQTQNQQKKSLKDSLKELLPNLITKIMNGDKEPDEPNPGQSLEFSNELEVKIGSTLLENINQLTLINIMAKCYDDQEVKNYLISKRNYFKNTFKP